MAKKNESLYDEHIIAALKELTQPIIGKSGKKFYFREMARQETGFEHIAKKSHRLKVRDIEIIPEILRHPISEHRDPANYNYRNYYGIRRGDQNIKSLLKIVTWEDEHDSLKETIITIYPVKTIKDY